MKRLLLGVLVLWSTEGQSTICGEDQRQISYEPRVGRVRFIDIYREWSGKGPCSSTLIGRSCLVTAGHCTDDMQYVEFNTQTADLFGMHPARPEDLYAIDPSSVVAEDEWGVGKDWGVFRVQRNALTQKFPGEVQGFFPVSFRTPNVGDVVQIYGYGNDYEEPINHYSQQLSYGPLTTVNFEESSLHYKVDTRGGNSGSGIIDITTGRFIGVHTNGGCTTEDGSDSNRGTALTNNKTFQEAVYQCLWETGDLNLFTVID